MTNTLFIRDLLYSLKQDYGKRMNLYIPQPAVVQDLSRGTQNVSYLVFAIDQVVILPQLVQNRFVHDVAFLAAGRNFAYGGLFQEGVADVFIDGDDLPPKIVIDTACHIIYDHVRYDMMTVSPLESASGWIIKMKKVNTLPAREIVNLCVGSCFNLKGVLNETTVT